VVGPISDWTSLESEQRLQEHGIDAPLRVAVGGIVQTVSEEARQEQADLMIIGRGSVAEPFGRLRTHTFSLIQRSPCPVVSVWEPGFTCRHVVFRIDRFVQYVGVPATESRDFVEQPLIGVNLQVILAPAQSSSR
jgi:hypothetical protein